MSLTLAFSTTILEPESVIGTETALPGNAITIYPLTLFDGNPDTRYPASIYTSSQQSTDVDTNGYAEVRRTNTGNTFKWFLYAQYDVVINGVGANLQNFVTASTQPPNSLLYLNNQNNFSSHSGSWGNITTVYGKKIILLNYYKKGSNHPNYQSLITGYSLDSRKIPDYPTVNFTSPTSYTIFYYRQNKSESIPNLVTADWVVYTIKDAPIGKHIINIKDCVLSTLYCDNPLILNLIKDNTTLANCYPFSDLLPENISSLFVDWNILFEADNSNSVNGAVTTPEYILRSLTANNNKWENGNIENDIAFDITHPMFEVNNQRAYDWHIKPQSDGSFGDLVMNSPLLEDIGKALDVKKWSVNTDDPTLPRVDNLGWRINRICDIAGIRVKTDGTIDVEKDKKLVRQVIDKDKRLEPKDGEHPTFYYFKVDKYYVLV